MNFFAWPDQCVVRVGVASARAQCHLLFAVVGAPCGSLHLASASPAICRLAETLHPPGSRLRMALRRHACCPAGWRGCGGAFSPSRGLLDGLGTQYLPSRSWSPAGGPVRCIPGGPGWFDPVQTLALVSVAIVLPLSKTANFPVIVASRPHL